MQELMTGFLTLIAIFALWAAIVAVALWVFAIIGWKSARGVEIYGVENVEGEILFVSIDKKEARASAIRKEKILGEDVFETKYVIKRRKW